MNDTIDIKMKKTIDILQKKFISMRAGVANPSILNNISVEYYGVDTPLKQVASITVPEARVLMITPFDKNVLKNIEQSIFMSDLGITPTNDGSVIRLVIPILTEENRKELVKNAKAESEKNKVIIRNIRRDAMEVNKKNYKQNEISEDEFHDVEENIQEITNSYIKKIDKLTSVKSEELLTI